jgi:hypothetical protein
MRRRSSGVYNTYEATREGPPDTELDEIEEQLRALWRDRGYGSPSKACQGGQKEKESSRFPGPSFQPPLTASEMAVRLMKSIDAELASPSTPQRVVTPPRPLPPSVLVVDIVGEYVVNAADSILDSPNASPITPSLSPPHPRGSPPPTPTPTSCDTSNLMVSPLRVVSATIVTSRPALYDEGSILIEEEEDALSPAPRRIAKPFDDVVVSPSTVRSESTSQGAYPVFKGKSEVDGGLCSYAPSSGRGTRPIAPNAHPSPPRGPAYQACHPYTYSSRIPP